jgi:hypothetical protein
MRFYRWTMVLFAVVILGGGAQLVPTNAQPEKGTAKFPDFEFLPPPDQYTGRVFRLSQEYPGEKPADGTMPDFFKTDFRTQWREYLMQVRAYCFQGNIRVGGDVEADFDVAEQTPPRWFHIPWQHYGPQGREGVHGLTQEAPVQPRQLAWNQTYKGGQTFAVGFFNDLAGYTIGQVWKDHENPDVTKAMFPNGAVIFKLLFVDVPTDQVPSLANPVQWTAFVPPSYTAPSGTPRIFNKLALIQMDIAVRDPRSTIGWVFGTFQYNGALNNANRWENLVPLGAQWGNDPDVTVNDSNPQPVATQPNPLIKESIINPDAKELPPTHLGWNGRLNGPVDNPMSSCISCHMTASVPALVPLSPLFTVNAPVPSPSSPTWMKWFRNIQCGESFDPTLDMKPTDFSLQLAISVQNFNSWKAEAKALSASDYHETSEAPRRKGPPRSPLQVRIRGRNEYKILRDVE